MQAMHHTDNSKCGWASNASRMSLVSQKKCISAHKCSHQPFSKIIFLANGKWFWKVSHNGTFIMCRIWWAVMNVFAFTQQLYLHGSIPVVAFFLAQLLACKDLGGRFNETSPAIGLPPPPLEISSYSLPNIRISLQWLSQPRRLWSRIRWNMVIILSTTVLIVIGFVTNQRISCVDIN